MSLSALAVAKSGVEDQLAYQNQILTEMNDRQRRVDYAEQQEALAEWKRRGKPTEQEAKEMQLKKMFLTVLQLSLLNPENGPEWRKRAGDIYDRDPEIWISPEVQAAVKELYAIEDRSEWKKKYLAEHGE